MIRITLLINFFVYGALMIIIRLHITEMAYQFDHLKDYERSLQEEQVRLRAELAYKISPEVLTLEGFTEPLPDQIIELP